MIPFSQVTKPRPGTVGAVAGPDGRGSRRASVTVLAKPSALLEAVLRQNQKRAVPGHILYSYSHF